MLTPRNAPVRPRVLGGEGREPFLLEEEVVSLLRSEPLGRVVVLGAPGSGKTTALEHLAAVLPPDAPVALLDEPSPSQVRKAGAGRLVVYAARGPVLKWHSATYRLAPWDRDAVIEYLLAAHRGQCAAVMGRLGDADHGLFRGIPELWRLVLDELAADPSLPNARAALHRHLDDLLPDTDLLQRAGSACLNALTRRLDSADPVRELGEAGFVQGVVRVLRHPEVQRLLAAERIAADLHDGADCDFLALRLPWVLIRAAAPLVAGDDQALQQLRDLITGHPWAQAMAVSVLLAGGPGWRPEPGEVLNLTGAYLRRAAWPLVELAHVKLCEADLRSADLSRANLDMAVVSRARLSQALLVAASLDRWVAKEADLTAADLSSARGEAADFGGARLGGANLQDAAFPSGSFVGADLSGAVLAGANLCGAAFLEADVRGADFSGANLAGADLSGLRLREAVLRGASLRGARLEGCDMEYLDLGGACLRTACLRGALLTGALLPGADLANADLCGARLGDVNLESACLRGADLTGATFHMGSSRSGLLITPIASEGTRTGFYTDESEEQYFQAPEDIRKANLRGADLRGARVEGVDFYLVDLRGARYDAGQEEHFRRCRAILSPRT